VTDTAAPKRPYALAILLIVFGLLGLLAAFQLTIDKIAVLENPEATLSCNVSPIVQCGKNLGSWQGAVFGFPNPLIGLICWPATIFVGVSLLAGARFPRWFWITFNVGVLGAFVFIWWLQAQSFFVLGTLCLWCALTWAVTIPTFLLVTLHNLRNGTIPLPPRGRAIAEALYGWVPVITVLCYLIIAVNAQLGIELFTTLF
jgi:uncharacterized membrane protein